MPVFLGADGVTAFGYLAHSETTVGPFGIGDTEVEATNLRLDFTVPGSETVRVRATSQPRVQTANAAATADVYVDILASGVPLTPRGGGSQHVSAPGGAGGRTINAWGLWTLEPGDYQARVYVKRTAGTGTITVGCTSEARLLLLVESLG